MRACNGYALLPVAYIRKDIGTVYRPDSALARFFQFDSAGTNIRFFVLRSSDGVLRSAFDACDVCYRSRKGYRQLGDLMVCSNCGQSFPSVLINVEKGGCNPSPLERTVSEGQIAFRVADIQTGARLF